MQPINDTLWNSHTRTQTHSNPSFDSYFNLHLHSLFAIIILVAFIRPLCYRHHIPIPMTKQRPTEQNTSHKYLGISPKKKQSLLYSISAVFIWKFYHTIEKEFLPVLADECHCTSQYCKRHILNLSPKLSS